MLDEIKKELIEEGKNPDDFNITVDGDTVKIEPTKGYETRKEVRLELENQKLQDQIDELALTILSLMEV